MKVLFSFLRRIPLARKRGSVLILVVALLTLMALMATAYMSTVRMDRAPITAGGSSAVGGEGVWLSENAGSMDNAMTAALETVGTAVLNAVFDPPAVPGPGTYRNAGSANYRHYTSPHLDTWLASRVPDSYALRNTASSPNNDNRTPRWAFVSQLPGVTRFESPLQAGTVYPFPDTNDYFDRTDLIPTSVTITYDWPLVGFLWPPELDSKTRVFPALRIPGGATYLAGDADGDGVADSPLFRIDSVAATSNTYYFGVFSFFDHPVRYYAAVRIVDNCAALNVNTAWDSVNDLDAGTGATTAASGFFRSHAGLLQLVHSSNAAEVSALNQVRFGGALGSIAPYSDTGARIDLSFSTLAETLEMQLSRRMENPGARDDMQRFTALRTDAGAAHAYRMTFFDPGQPSTGDIERNLSNSSLLWAANWAGAFATAQPDYARMFRYYPASRGDFWFNYNFNFDLTSRSSFFTTSVLPAPWNTLASMSVPPSPPLRPLLVASNPVSNSIPSHHRLMGPWNGATSYAFGDAVKAVDPTDNRERTYVCIRANAGQSPTAAYSTYWQKMSWTDNPVRTSINTAPFGELWLGFWSVMGHPVNVNDPENASAGMFLNSLRNAAKTLNTKQMLKLRSALAAVNAMDLRDSDDDITSRNVSYDSYNIRVHGTEAQPYITRVVTNVGAGSAGTFAAVELHNPFGRALPVQNWRLALLNRSTMSLADLSTPFAFGAGATINPGEYLVLRSSASMPAGVALNPTARVINVPGLESLTGRELVLLRPHRADGVLQAVNDPANPAGNYDEQALTNPRWLEDLVPLDSFDATALTTANRRYIYTRPSGAGQLWRHVYAGTAPAASAANTAVTLGAASATASFTKTFTIQLSNTDFPGPNKISAGPNKFPYGGFARAGDILQVPFIGGYRVTDTASGALLEINTVTADAVKAEDSATTDADEQVGRFCPVVLTSTTHPYYWATDLLDYFTAQHNPHDDYLPNIAPDAYVFPNKSANTLPAPQAVPNGPITDPAQANNGREDNVPIEGLININTASWRVLATLPMIPNNPTANEELAKAIVLWRDGGRVNTTNYAANGPFRTIFDLNRVVDPRATAKTFQNAWGLLPADPDNTWGDLSPVGAADGIGDDFERRFLMINRISNLITTRSDSFTCYILVQGWQDAGTSTPVLVSERRAAFIIDRSQITQIKNTLADLVRLDVPTK